MFIILLIFIINIINIIINIIIIIIINIYQHRCTAIIINISSKLISLSLFLFSLFLFSILGRRSCERTEFFLNFLRWASRIVDNEQE